ncbi:MAG: hypothetical protein ACOX5G_02580 [Kiritimatiellia bacterium]
MGTRSVENKQESRSKGDVVTMRWISLIGMVFCSLGCAQTSSKPEMQTGFVRYAIDFHVEDLESDKFPEVITLSEEVYTMALQCKSEDPGLFGLAVALILSKYHHFYLATFRQGYGLIDPSDFESGEYLKEGNTRYFLVREFLDTTGCHPVIDDASSASANAWFLSHCDMGKSEHLALRNAWLKSRNERKAVLDKWLDAHPDYPKNAFEVDFHSPW